MKSTNVLRRSGRYPWGQDKKDIENNLQKCAKQLEELGMNHTHACAFISIIMNMGIALQELHINKKQEIGQEKGVANE